MSDYIVIVGKRDSERFRRFSVGYDTKIIKDIPNLSKAANIWALGPSTVPDTWSSIRKNDRIFFAENGLPFRHYGIVSGKATNQTHAIRIWGDTPRIRGHNRIILFSSIHSINMPFTMMCRNTKVKLNQATNIYPAENVTLETEIPKKNFKEFVFLSDDGNPDKIEEVVTRFIRDTKKVRALKNLYNNACQICKYTIDVNHDKRYSEVHHLHPLKDKGDDDYSNMIVLCPTHHVEFDYKIIGIDTDGKTIINKDKKPVGKIMMKKEHKLHSKNIKFHLMEMGI